MSGQYTRLVSRKYVNNDFKFGHFDNLPIDKSERARFGIYYKAEISTFFGPEWDGPKHLKKRRGYYGKKGKLQMVGKFLAEGFSIRKSAEMAAVNKNTAMRFKHTLEAINGLFNCPCGQISSHRGWCSWRYAKSEDRQEFMKKWHK